MKYLSGSPLLNHAVTLIGGPEETADVETAKNAKTQFLGSRKNLQNDLAGGSLFEFPLLNLPVIEGARNRIQTSDWLPCLGGVPRTSSSEIGRPVAIRRRKPRPAHKLVSVPI